MARIFMPMGDRIDELIKEYRYSVIAFIMGIGFLVFGLSAFFYTIFVEYGIHVLLSDPRLIFGKILWYVGLMVEFYVPVIWPAIRVFILMRRRLRMYYWLSGFLSEFETREDVLIVPADADVEYGRVCVYKCRFFLGFVYETGGMEDFTSRIEFKGSRRINWREVHLYNFIGPYLIILESVRGKGMYYYVDAPAFRIRRGGRDVIFALLSPVFPILQRDFLILQEGKEYGRVAVVREEDRYCFEVVYDTEKGGRLELSLEAVGVRGRIMKYFTVFSIKEPRTREIKWTPPFLEEIVLVPFPVGEVPYWSFGSFTDFLKREFTPGQETLRMF